MTKISALSEYGFKLDSNPDKWISCDKRFSASKEFKDIKVGSEIASIMYNDKGFVSSVIILNYKGSEVESDRSSLSHNNINSLKSDSLPSVKDSIRYAQSVNIAFQSIGICDLTFKEDYLIRKAFDIADSIYDEFNKRCLK